MRRKTVHPIVAAAILTAVAFTIWPGCITPPLPSTRKAIMDRKNSDYKPQKTARLTRDEVIQKLGNPDLDFADLNILAYRVNDVTRRNLVLVLFVIPFSVQTHPGYQDIAFIQLDSEQRVQRTAVVNVSKNVDLHREAEFWGAQSRVSKR